MFDTTRHSLQRRLRWLFIVLAAGIVLFAGLAVRGIIHNQVLKRQEDTLTKDVSKVQDIQRNAFTEGQFYIDDNNAGLTFPPVQLDDITEIVPLGFASSGEEQAESGAGTHQIPSDHMYVRSQPAQKGETRVFKVYAVAESYIVNVPYAKGAWAGPDGTPHVLDSYTLQFQVSKNLFVFITDLTDLEPGLKAQIGELTPGSQNFRAIPVKSGQLLGQSGSGAVLTSVDFWAIDLRHPAQYVHPDWHGQLDEYSVNPLDYYAEPLRSQLYDKLPLRAEPRAGQFAYDIDGRLVGDWFPLHNESDSINTRPDIIAQLGFFYWNYDSSVVEIGYIPRNAVWIVGGNTPDPAAISVKSGAIKYELMRDTSREPTNPAYFQTEAIMLVQMMADRKLRVEIFDGKTAVEVIGFDANAMEFYR